MSHQARFALAGVTFAATLAGSIADAQEQNPFTGSPDEAVSPSPPPKPKRRIWNARDGKFLMSFEFVPGIPEPGNVVEITITVSELPDQRHPRFGSRIPIRKARIVVEVEDPSGALDGRYLTHSPPLSADRYAFHVTPEVKGIHVLRLKGTTRDARALSARIAMPVAVWPLPDHLKGTGAEAGGGLTRRRPVIKK